MIEREFADLVQLADKRNALYYAWIRQLVLMASGSLTVMVSLNAGGGSTGAALAFHHIAAAMLGAGILSGSVALYGEVAMVKRLVTQAAGQLRKKMKDTQAGAAVQPTGPAVAPFEPWMRTSARSCYTSLITAVIAMVAFALTR